MSVEQIVNRAELIANAIVTELRDELDATTVCNAGYGESLT
jgi:hypothetical protein